jgi:hypothetical protein
MSIKPFFVVNACSKCDQHKYARHDEAKYAAYRDAIIAALKSAIPSLDDSQIVTGKLPQEYRTQQDVELNNGFSRVYRPTIHMTELAEMQKMNESRGLSLAPIGGLEIYFMGLKIFSKILTGQWPDPDAIADRCKEAFKQYNAG